MFEKKEIIFSETLGVCQVADVTRLTAKSGEQLLYYRLVSVADKKKVSYIPVEHHKVQLRPLISFEEAKTLQENPAENMSEAEKAELKYVIGKIENQ